MKMLKPIVYAVIAAFAIVLLTALVNTTPGGLVGAAWYGLPLTWLIRMVVAPQYNPWALRYVNLALDLVFWFVIALIVELALLHLKRPKRRK